MFLIIIQLLSFIICWVVWHQSYFYVCVIVMEDFYDSQTQTNYKKDNSRKNKVNSTEKLVKTTTEKKSFAMTISVCRPALKKISDY